MMIGSSAKVRRLALVGACGLLLCAAVTALESLSQPLQNLDVAEVSALVRSIAWTWVLSGLWWAVAASLLSDLPVRRLVLSIAPLALAISLVHLGTWTIGLTLSLDGGSPDLMGLAPQPTAMFLHVLWANLFFGGLYLLSFAGYRRAWRSRRLLAELASSRAEVDAVQQEARLSAFRGQLQPGILIEALETLQTSYAQAPARADALFDELILFLRAAMPAIREQGATLGSELALVGHYAELRRRIGTGGGASIAVSPQTAPDVGFPALCLLPLIEALTGDIPLDAPLLLRRTGGDDWTGARLDIPCGREQLAPEVGAEPERRLRLELAALHGGAADLTLHRRSRRTIVSLRLPIRPDASPAYRPLIEERTP